MDERVLPSEDEIKTYYWEHGHPWSDTYDNPDLISLPSLLQYNANRRPEQVAFLRPLKDSFVKVTWREFNSAVNTLARHYSSALDVQLNEAIKVDQQPTVALLGTGHTIGYFATQLALLKLGIRVLLLSPSNADVATNHLLTVCNAVAVVSQANLQSAVHGLHVVELVPFEQSIAHGANDVSILAYNARDVWNSHSLIIHSSGTTGLPKPIIHTHRSLMLIARMYRLFPDFAINNWYLAFPLFHIAGISIALSGLPNGLTLSFPPENWPPAPGSILSAWKQLAKLGFPVDCLHCAPAVIQDLYEYITTTGNDFSPLVDLKVLQPGGAALNLPMVNKLIQVGVNVKTTYGSTEIGPPMRSIPHTRQNPHCYRVRNLYPEDEHYKMEALGDGLYEPVVYRGFPLAAELWLAPDAPNPYRTNDLFTEEPLGSGLYVLQGRKDDLLVHTNGEKTNALPLQMALDSCPQIVKAAVFGSGRPCVAALIQPSTTVLTAGDRECIFAAVESSSVLFPAHSRIARSMVHILGQGETLPVTPKGSVRRKEAERIYSAALNGMYERLENGDQHDHSVSVEAAYSDQEYILACVEQALGRQGLRSNANLYRLGLDSQKAVMLRSKLMKRFGRFPLHFIFEYPSVEALRNKLVDQVSSEAGITAPNRHHDWVRQAIDRYTTEIMSWSEPLATPPATPGEEVVYLTGATGALGNALLECFVANPTIEKVYCAIRGSSDRLRSSMIQRGYSSAVVNSAKLHVVPYSMADLHLGLGEDLYAQLAAKVTTVVHNAWKMDFNVPVTEFDGDCLQGTVRLMHFASTGRRKMFAFSSSVATHLGPAASGSEVAETEAINEPSLALDTGYAQSKFIIEIVLQAFARNTGLSTKAFRIGQLCGHSKHGSWNESEMFPIMFTTGLKQLKAIPTFTAQSVDWLPVDICAKAMSDILAGGKAEEPTHDHICMVHNLVNPRPISWTDFLDCLTTAYGESIQRVSMAEWVAGLYKLSEAGVVSPGMKLIGFFESMAQTPTQSCAVFATSRSEKLSGALASAPCIDTSLMHLYLQKWKETGFL
ncbi:hypothetical protein BAUCODRAFT_23288 [Baudoinia panamericana UAMH 10762]|uniref:Polyketide synthase-like phosphopantetheine-binding domain-containing protein n=1 Tax=Baudoinia panamericana (strain UAMH 10762) TaxID=717646 RepID=M2MPA2_BAUPA|nr:uncharacterized protein BAUCODRAFT_23288 [Baudoinia panamericana UAMH 10762]EMC98541.1 hypothetical protein BAUCODRAFT_23288 [Baudoinia panamericana UAMH 10762]